MKIQLISRRTNQTAEYMLCSISLGDCRRYLISVSRGQDTSMELVGESRESAARLFEQVCSCALYPEHLSDVVHDFMNIA